jgi:hypothetical protein
VTVFLVLRRPDRCRTFSRAIPTIAASSTQVPATMRKAAHGPDAEHDQPYAERDADQDQHQAADEGGRAAQGAVRPTRRMSPRSSVLARSISYLAQMGDVLGPPGYEMTDQRGRFRRFAAEHRVRLSALVVFWRQPST